MSNMMSYFDAYQSIISEQGDTNENDDNEQLNNQNNQEDQREIAKQDLAIKFTNNMASEFTQKVNDFTKVCAEMIEKRSVDAELYKKFKDLHDNIKKIVEASQPVGN